MDDSNPEHEHEHEHESEKRQEQDNSKSSCPISVVVHGYIDQMAHINPLNWQNGSESQDDVKVTFAWSNLSVSTFETRSGTCCGLRSGTVVPPKQILNNVSEKKQDLYDGVTVLSFCPSDKVYFWFSFHIITTLT